MPEKCRVGVCGYDPVLVKGYLGTGARALWWHISDEIYEEHQVKPGTKVEGTLLAVYNGEAEKTAEPNEAFTWEASQESGLAVLLPPEVIIKYELTEFHFLEMEIAKVGGKPVAPGEDRMSTKWWPDEKMKLDYKVGFIPP